MGDTVFIHVYISVCKMEIRKLTFTFCNIHDVTVSSVPPNVSRPGILKGLRGHSLYLGFGYYNKYLLLVTLVHNNE